MLNLTEHEKRILSYLDQHGLMHRETMVCDLASENSRIASRATGFSGRRYVQGSNGATPMIAANWCKRLVAEKLVVCRRDQQGFYMHHEITHAGRRHLRAALQENDGGGR